MCLRCNLLWMEQKESIRALNANGEKGNAIYDRIALMQLYLVHHAQETKPPT